MVDLSVCIVTYQAKEYLKDCLRSIIDDSQAVDYELIVVDNGSTDGVASMLEDEFPEVKLLRNPENQGYTRPMNRALRSAQGRYLMQLNPDTLILPGAFEHLVAFMDAHPQVGICGPKVLNADRTLQRQCRRGESRPWAVISYFTGLADRFPQDPRFAQYTLSFVDENETHEVAGVSGSCMLIRREVIDQIGYLDELFFAYQEDADFCLRARRAGWQVYYLPAAQIVHFGGRGGSRVQPYRSIIEWHKSYYLFYRKSYAAEYFFAFNWAYYAAMLLKLWISLSVNFLRREKFAGPRRGLANG